MRWIANGEVRRWVYAIEMRVKMEGCATLLMARSVASYVARLGLGRKRG